MSIYHTPILVKEVLKGLDIQSGKRYIDATFGGGGHTKEIVEAGGLVLGIDADSDAIQHWNEEEHINNKDHVRVVQGNFRFIEQIAKTNEWIPTAGILFDLGLSSHELDEKNRGFSFRFPEAPLDMRFSQQEGFDAKTFIANASKEELYEVFTKYGEEERSDAICYAIMRARSIKPIETVGDLTAVIEKIVGKGAYGRGVTTRIFQAIRIAVNDEVPKISSYQLPFIRRSYRETIF
jgi:16S rRNA (cytosine1402-N4)-methyltransferase